jgi:ribonuclease P/MRP protein subunit RPP1
MFYDLHVPWTDATRELQRTVAFLDECELPVPLRGG